MKHKQNSSLEEMHGELGKLLHESLEGNWEFGKAWFRYHAADASGIVLYAVDPSGQDIFFDVDIEIASKMIKLFEGVNAAMVEELGGKWVSAVLTLDRQLEVNIDFEYGEYYDPVADQEPRSRSALD